MRDLIFRKDIQGLRGIAVISVILFHFNEILPGGFLGVDIFFVISGYVITGSLQKNWEETGKINLLNFYWKRVKRLLPAVGIVVSTVSIATFFLFSPLGMQQNASKTGIGALTLSANIVISKLTEDYFGLAATTNPFLHIWSLSVEEQFYIFLPLVFLVAGLVKLRRTRRIVFAIVVITMTASSFSLMLMQAPTGWLSSFYSPITRAWEFGVGIIAFQCRELFIQKAKSSYAFTIFRVISFSVLIFSLLRFRSDFGYPSYTLAIPVIATGILLILGAPRKVTTALETSISQFIGDRSYSLYLWHWPFIVFSNYLFPSNLITLILGFGLSVVCTLLTYKFIENPVRTNWTVSYANLSKIVAIFLLVPIMLSGTVGFIAKKVLFPRYESGVIQGKYEGDIGAIGFETFRGANYGSCRNGEKSQGLKECEADIAVIGDSHADHLVPGFVRNFPELAVVSLSDLLITNPSEPQAKVQKYQLLQNQDIRIIVINKYWANSGVPASLKFFVNEIIKSGKYVVLLDDVPNFPFDSFACKYGKSIFLESSNCKIRKSSYVEQLSKYQSTLISIDNEFSNVSLFQSSNLFCDSFDCSMVKNGVLNYLDLNHLNVNGSTFVTRTVVMKEPIFCKILDSKLGDACPSQSMKP